MLHLEFSGEDGTQAILSAIEILPGARGHIRPVRILARQTPYYSNDSHLWSPDNYFEGGQLAAYTTPVSGTDDPELYETERWGNFTYAIPVSPGKYSVCLLYTSVRAQASPANSFGPYIPLRLCLPCCKKADKVGHVTPAHKQASAIYGITQHLGDPANCLRLDLACHGRKQPSSNVGVDCGGQ